MSKLFKQQPIQTGQMFQEKPMSINLKKRTLRQVDLFHFRLKKPRWRHR